jgi:hypothetical protein
MFYVQQLMETFEKGKKLQVQTIESYFPHRQIRTVFEDFP